MGLETRTCVKQEVNSRMGTLCYDDRPCVFYIDKNNWVKVNDVVVLERDEKGFYRKVWVNGELKTNDDFNHNN